jgi:hypothetical protein
MKKNFLLLILPLALLIGGCQKNEYVVPNKTILTTVSPGKWISSNGGRSYSANINMPEIDDYFNEHSGVLVYVSFGSVDYEAIPQVFEGISFRYITRPGVLVVTIESSDGLDNIDPPLDPMDVKVVLIESN